MERREEKKQENNFKVKGKWEKLMENIWNTWDVLLNVLTNICSKAVEFFESIH